MSWNWFNLPAPPYAQDHELGTKGGFGRQYLQEPKLPPEGTRMDPKTGAYVPAKREVTVVRSTRAMPERKR